MILITTNSGKYELNCHQSSDVLESFIKDTQVSKEDIKVELLPNELKEWSLKENNRILNFDTDGFVKKCTISFSEDGLPQLNFVGEPIPLLKLKQWPYDEQGNFLGNQFE